MGARDGIDSNWQPFFRQGNPDLRQPQLHQIQCGANRSRPAIGNLGVTARLLRQPDRVYFFSHARNIATRVPVFFIPFGRRSKKAPPLPAGPGAKDPALLNNDPDFRRGGPGLAVDFGKRLELDEAARLRIKRHCFQAFIIHKFAPGHRLTEVLPVGADI